MAKKLTKEVKGAVLHITVGEESLVFDSDELSDSIKFNLAMHGLSQKLGDSAAGKEGEEAVKSIKTVWDGLVAGNWTVRAPAGEKISKTTILDNLAKMPEEKQAAVKELLASLGLKI
jgi:hypothetical protein